MYKKVYVEITNNCNLSCEFCPHNKRINEFISFESFKTILDKLAGYTEPPAVSVEQKSAWD